MNDDNMSSVSKNYSKELKSDSLGLNVAINSSKNV